MLRIYYQNLALHYQSTPRLVCLSPQLDASLEIHVLNTYQTFERMTNLVNIVVPQIDYWQILGDNFYDRDGHLTQAWFDQLSLEVKTTLFATVAGNHDYWGFGSGVIGLDIDQFGNGLMQYYGMDTVSSVKLSKNKTA